MEKERARNQNLFDGYWMMCCSNWGRTYRREVVTNHALMASKLKIMRRIGMKAVKEKEQLQKTVDSWKDSSKNLWKLVDSGNQWKIWETPSTERIGMKWMERELVRKVTPSSKKKGSVCGMPKEIGALLSRPQQVIIGGEQDQTPLIIDHPLKNMENRGIFDSGCLGHMTSNKDHLDDFEECKGGSVTFGGSKGYITVSPDFKMPDENHILLKVPRQHNMYSFDMKTPSLTKDYACLIAKATSDESKLWHRRFSWVFFLATKDETSGILQNFIRQIENQLNHRVKIIRSDNGTEFKNRDMLEFDTPEILAFRNELDELDPKHLREVPKNKATSTTSVNSGSGPVNTQHAAQDDSDMPELIIFNKPQKGIFDEASYDVEGMVHDFNTYNNEEPKKISEALKDDSWVEAMQEELLQFRLQQVWILVDLPHGAKVIRTKWVYRNKREERGVSCQILVQT
ncbi:putative ribonuclease H-like domain-containing protein [Tanacetum coccineum]